MESNENYFDKLPDEAVRLVLSFVPGADRLKLQLLGNKRIGQIAVSMMDDTTSFHTFKTESDVMVALKYSKLKKFHFPATLKASEEWFMTYARKLSISCPMITKFSVHNDAIQLPYYYMINIDDGIGNRVESLDITVSEKMEEIPFAVMFVSVMERSKKLTHVSLTCKVKVCREAMDVVIEVLKKKNIKSMHVSFSTELVYFLREVIDLEKLSISDTNELDNSYLNGVIQVNPRLKFLHVMRYGIFNSFRSLRTLRHLETLIIDLRNPFGLRLDAKEMIESIPSSIKTLMIAFNCMTSAQSLTSLPLQVPMIEKLYFCSRFPRAKRTPNRFMELIDIFTQMTTLRELFVSIEMVQDDLEETIRQRLPHLTKLVIMTRGREIWTEHAEEVSILKAEHRKKSRDLRIWRCQNRCPKNLFKLEVGYPRIHFFRKSSPFSKWKIM